jgi:hypothetical protein
MDTSPIWSELSVVKDGLLALLAIYGAILSTFNWRQASRKDRRELIVCASTAVPPYATGVLGKALAKIEATNTGYRAVTVKTLAFELPNRNRMFTRPNAIPGLSDTALPATLVDGQPAHVYMSYGDSPLRYWTARILEGLS